MPPQAGDWRQSSRSAVILVGRADARFASAYVNPSNYVLLATIHNDKTTAVAVSIAHAACEHPHLIKNTPATVTGAMAVAATPARSRRVISIHQQNPIGRVLP
jgi:hypothetical protein